MGWNPGREPMDFSIRKKYMCALIRNVNDEGKHRKEARVLVSSARIDQVFPVDSI